MLNVLEMLGKPVYDLLHVGTTVTVIHYNEFGPLVHRGDLSHRMLTRCPVNNFFPLTKQE
jgi:hypothetical protein